MKSKRKDIIIFKCRILQKDKNKDLKRISQYFGKSK